MKTTYVCDIEVNDEPQEVEFDISYTIEKEEDADWSNPATPASVEITSIECNRSQLFIDLFYEQEFDKFQDYILDCYNTKDQDYYEEDR